MGLFRRERHGCWVEILHRRGRCGYVCSECGREADEPYDECPSCGAVMDRIIDEAEAFEELDILLSDY